MDLFELNAGVVKPSVHALLIRPYKEIWARDMSEDKTQAIKWFTYIELVASPKKSNPFSGYAEEIRPSKVKKEVFGDENYEIPLELMEAVIAYKEHLSDSSESYQLAMAGLHAANKIKLFLVSFNLTDEKNRLASGGYALKPKDVTATLKELPDVIKSMEEMKNKVHEELTQASKTRGGREIGQYER